MFAAKDREAYSTFKERKFCSLRCSGKANPALPVAIEGRFWRCIKIEDGGCWRWIGAFHPDGYGWIQFNRIPTKAHRVAYVLTRGAVQPGMGVLHVCGNRWCVNPNHLYAGTAQDNSDDARHHGTTARGERNARHKITWADAWLIRHKYFSGTNQRALSEQYGITQTGISDILHGKRWVEAPCRNS